MLDKVKQAVTDRAVNEMRTRLDLGNWTDREKVVLTCRMLAMENHSETLAGQITVRCDDGTYLTTPLAVAFDEIEPHHVIRVDDALRLLEGKGMANPAVRFHLWVYRRRPDVRSIVHTHPPYVSTLSMTGRPLRVAHMDATPFFDDCAFLKEWPGLPIADDEGEIISSALGTRRTILLAHHGFLAATSSIEETAYLSMLIERAARNQLMAETLGPVKELDPALARESHDFLLQPSIVKASFAMFGRRVLRHAPDALRDTSA
ncbi:aldolase [Pandoraea nosoerga]|uniref:Aldolase n=1 Tax=Pandoraea nosoerga TaxID=2508296 RepID=A0A5E4XJZ3_9BURK|nr:MULTISPECIES: aldolase [Pandoraea]MBN4667236.1 aldolase [Pandoraea nosoerga]MBN4677223.1 aldolase [Pandoraea nosoerga]MBN4681955.1 aldolase [Pandoraea nosoerga]MBN4746273.1 aldolase [Pandoraea nosoerga]VVE36488.1 aldolase [Pandoraea nosoerga]